LQICARGGGEKKRESLGKPEGLHRQQKKGAVSRILRKNCAGGKEPSPIFKRRETYWKVVFSKGHFLYDHGKEGLEEKNAFATEKEPFRKKEDGGGLGGREALRQTRGGVVF